MAKIPKKKKKHKKCTCKAGDFKSVSGGVCLKCNPTGEQDKALTRAEFPQFDGMGLTLKQQRFILSYTSPAMAFNATRAYIDAYALDGIDDYMTAAANASVLLKNPKVQRAISIELDRQLNNHDALARRVLGEWQKLAFVDVTNFLQVSGPFVYLPSIEDLPAHFRPAIRSIENTQSGVKVTFHDKNKALENIAKCLGMFASDKVEVVDESYEGLVQRLAREENEKGVTE